MNTLDIYLAYLRKSREDLDFERNNIEYKTLERHKERLTMIANAINKAFSNQNIYEEVVSGDSIAERPEIQRLLNDIENPRIKGVWVVDVQRLCRGDLGDQDRIIKAFKYTNTMILTPDKEYDLTNASDEEYLIDKLSFSRKEYNNIKKRLNEGRLDSIRNGCWLGNPPYGYERYKLRGEKGWSLKIVEEQANIVKMIFKLVLEGKGTCFIENELNKMHIPSPGGKEWRADYIRFILSNIAYIGYVKFQSRKKVSYMENRILKTKNERQENFLKVKGRHEAIISEEDFNVVQEKLRNSSEKYVRNTTELRNPLAGIVRCEKCGIVLNRHQTSTKRAQVYCKNYKKCGMVGNYIDQIEILIINSLKEYVKNQKKLLSEYKKDESVLKNSIEDKINIINKEIEKEKIKVNRIRSFLEDGTYDKETYNLRISPTLEKVKNLEDSKKYILENNEELKIEKIKDLIPKMEECINNYFSLDIIGRNKMLKSVLNNVTYSKTKIKEDSDLKITIYPKI